MAAPEPDYRVKHPSHLSIIETLITHPTKRLYHKPLQWTNDHLKIFGCRFQNCEIENDGVDNGELASPEESVDESDEEKQVVQNYVQKLATTGDPLAIKYLLKPYIDEPLEPLFDGAHGCELHFLFDYDHGDDFHHRILLDGACVLADDPVSVCFLDLRKVRRERKRLTGISPRKNPMHDPFVAAVAIAMVQRLAFQCLHRAGSRADRCHDYLTHILVPLPTRRRFRVYTALIKDAFIDLFDYPYRRPDRCRNEACYKVTLDYTTIDYEPSHTFPARVWALLKGDAGPLDIDDKIDDEQESSDNDDEPAVEQQQSSDIDDAPAVEQQQSSDIDDAPAVEQQQSSNIDDAPAVKRWRVKAALVRIMKWPVQMIVK